MGVRPTEPLQCDLHGAHLEWGVAKAGTKRAEGSPHPGWYCLQCRREKRMPWQQRAMGQGVPYPERRVEWEIQAEIFMALKAEGWDVHAEVRLPEGAGRADLVIFEEQQAWLVLEVKRYRARHNSQADWYECVGGVPCVMVWSVGSALDAVAQHMTRA